MLLRQISSKRKGDFNQAGLYKNQFGAKQTHDLLPGKALLDFGSERWIEWLEGFIVHWSIFNPRCISSPKIFTTEDTTIIQIT
jgi:hypothetical protein